MKHLIEAYARGAARGCEFTLTRDRVEKVTCVPAFASVLPRRTGTRTSIPDLRVGERDPREVPYAARHATRARAYAICTCTLSHIRGFARDINLRSFGALTVSLAFILYEPVRASDSARNARNIDFVRGSKRDARRQNVIRIGDTFF